MGWEGRAHGHKTSCGPFHFNERFQLLGSLRSRDPNRPAVDGPPVLVLPAVEENVPLLFGHLQDGAGVSLHPPFLRPGADGLAGELGDGGGAAGLGHASRCRKRDQLTV
jgi:hypothetical protein